MRIACSLLVLLSAPRARAQADCSDIQAQLDRDKIALERQQAANARALEELDKWTKENEEAQRTALEKACDLLIRGVVGGFAEQYSLALDEVQKKTARIQRADPAFMADLKELIDKRNQLKAIVELMKPLKGKSKELGEIFDDLRKIMKKTKEAAADIGKIVGKIVLEEGAKEIFEKVALPKLVSGFEKQFLTKELAPFLDDTVKPLQVVIDYGYSATDWNLSRQRILDQYKLSDENVRAMESVGCQYERSVARLATCRGEPPPVLRARCRIAASKCGKPPFEVPAACRGKDRGACEAAIVAPCTKYLSDYMTAHGRRVTTDNCAPCARAWAADLVPLTP